MEQVNAQTMQALYLDGNVVLREDMPVPIPKPGESLVRVHLSGVCATDLEEIAGYKGFKGILGHEFVGTVVESDDPGLVGQRVVGQINGTCAAEFPSLAPCRFCAMGNPAHCERGSTLGIAGRDGSHAEYLTLPTPNLLVVPPELRDDEAVFTELVAAACEILDQVHIRPTHRVVVIGDGRLGNLCAQVISLLGPDLCVMGRHQEKLDLLQGAGIQTERVRRGEESTLEAGSADVVIEVSGGPSGLSTAMRLVKPRGTIVLKSTYQGAAELNLSQAVVREVSVVGSRGGPPFAAALRLLSRRLVDVRPLISDRFPLGAAIAALERAGQPGASKVLLEMPSGAPDK